MVRFPRMLAVAALALSAGCSERRDGPAAPHAAASLPAASAPAEPPSAPPTDQWAGKWNGPEGTYLEIAGRGGKYQLTIGNLDGPRRFEGRHLDGRIAFQRDGQDETVRATNGDETGMKWLAGKSTCLTIRSGEGYCRDR